MKIAFYSYPSAFQNPGGGEVQLLKTKEALEAKGVTVELFNQWRDKLDSFDILHVFGSVKDCVGLMQTAKNKGVKIALSTIFWSSFKRGFNEEGGLKAKGEHILRHAAKLFFPTFSSGRRKTMSLADILLPNSNAEAVQLKRLFAIPKNKIHVVPNGVSGSFKSADPEVFSGKYGLRDFILAVGRIEPRKNQLSLIKALRAVETDLVIVGDPVSDYKDYYAKCKKAAGKRVLFLGSIKHEDGSLASAYAACKVFVAPGWFETPGLAALEAGLAGARLAVTKYGCTKEYFLDYAEYFDPSDLKQIRTAVSRAQNRPKNSFSQDHIYGHYTWEKVAESTIAAYRKILS
jgi:glycosyltransferase involved in cell wall biosynthesis